MGLEHTAYTVDEVDGFQLVCIDVLSGDIDGRDIILHYSTSSGSASMFCFYAQFFQAMYLPESLVCWESRLLSTFVYM